jgi:hypothetical protein
LLVTTWKLCTQAQARHQQYPCHCHCPTQAQAQAELEATRDAAHQSEEESVAALQQLQAQLAELQATSSMRIKDLEYWNNELVAENQRLSRQLETAQEEVKALPRGPLQANRPGSRRASGPDVAAQVGGFGHARVAACS